MNTRGGCLGFLIGFVLMTIIFGIFGAIAWTLFWNRQNFWAGAVMFLWFVVAFA